MANIQETRTVKVPKVLGVGATAASAVKELAFQPTIKRRFEEVLGQRAPQFISSLISIAREMPPECDAMSIVQAGMMAACLNLPIDKNLGLAWIIPYREHQSKLTAQFQIGYKGFIQLALRSGQYLRMNAAVICEGGLKGYDSIGEPIIDWTKVYDYDVSGIPRKVIGYAFAWRLVNGFEKTVFWSHQQVIDHAARYSRSYRKRAEIWTTNFDEMALKTVIANALRRWGVLSIDMQMAYTYDAESARGEDSMPIKAEDELVPHMIGLDGADETQTNAEPSEVTTTRVEPELTSRKEAKPAQTESKAQPDSASVKPYEEDNISLDDASNDVIYNNEMPQTEVEQPTKESEQAKPAPKKTRAASNPREQLKELMRKDNISLEKVIQYAKAMGHIPNDYPDNEDIPESLAKLYVKMWAVVSVPIKS